MMSKYVFATANHHDKGVSILNCFQTIEWQTFEARQIHKFEGGGHQSAPFFLCCGRCRSETRFQCGKASKQLENSMKRVVL